MNYTISIEYQSLVVSGAIEPTYAHSCTEQYCTFYNSAPCVTVPAGTIAVIPLGMKFDLKELGEYTFLTEYNCGAYTDVELIKTTNYGIAIVGRVTEDSRQVLPAGSPLITISTQKPVRFIAV